ncbi:hypothetical protein [Microseira wollei]|uniref:hypothetical protein n=1 Tax=Microseira wollei TaxID=467598 RepID=UPI001CFE8E7C|nr:hypothetical protein [Microseira wollei]
MELLPRERIWLSTLLEVWTNEVHVPQFKTNPITGWQISLPKVGKIPINLHRPIPEGFAIKQARVLRKADRWEVVITIESDVSIPDAQPHRDARSYRYGMGKVFDNL